MAVKCTIIGQFTPLARSLSLPAGFQQFNKLSAPNPNVRIICVRGTRYSFFNTKRDGYWADSETGWRCVVRKIARGSTPVLKGRSRAALTWPRKSMGPPTNTNSVTDGQQRRRGVLQRPLLCVCRETLVSSPILTAFFLFFYQF